MTAQPRRRLRSLRALVHGLAILGGWLVFFWFWWKVAGRPWESQDLRLVVAAAIVLFPLVTGIWILHNVGIYKRLGPRRAVPASPVRYERDFYGRRIDSDWGALHAAQSVVIECDGAVKHYRAARPEPA